MLRGEQPPHGRGRGAVCAHRPPLDLRSRCVGCDPCRVIVGIGVDVVNVPRFSATLLSVGGLRRLCFAPDELVSEDGRPRSHSALAARYAAKEAASKALGIPSGLRLLDVQVVPGTTGEPQLHAAGTMAAAAARAGVNRWHVSLSVEGDVAMAMVVAEGPGRSWDDSALDAAEGVEVR